MNVLSYHGVYWFLSSVFCIRPSRCNGAFTLPDTETHTEIETDTVNTNKLTKNETGICIDVGLCAVLTHPHNSIQTIFICLSIGFGVGQYEYTIKTIIYLPLNVVRLRRLAAEGPS